MDCPVTARPTVIVISDSLGDTACEVVLAASGQFDEGAFLLLRLPKVTSVEQVESFVGPRVDADHRDIAVFHTIVDPALRARVLDYLGMLHIRSVDLIGPTLAVLSSLIGVPPKGVAGVIHKTDDRYFHRIEAMEYFVEHDDGRGCDDLSGADIVLLGVSRTSKTPLSMYLAYQGYKVACRCRLLCRARESAQRARGSSCPHEAPRLLCGAYRRQGHRGKRCRDH